MLTEKKWMPLTLFLLLLGLAAMLAFLLPVGFAGAQNEAFTCDQIPELECSALKALYQNTNGDQWINRDGWLDSSTPCSWHGITCNESNSNISQIILANNNLNGPIPVELENLSELTWLDFGSNNLNGTIPGQLGNLSNLRTLYLAGNQLEGPIPYQLGDLSNLELLYLNRNRLEGAIPNQIGQLGQLQFLYLDGSRLSGVVPNSICALGSLATTSLGYNKLNVGDTDGCVDQLDPEWRNSQTIPPTSIQAVIPQAQGAENYAIEISWQPIAYDSDPGFYEIYLSTSSGGPYQLAGRTIDKTASNHTVRNLNAGTPYYFILRTVTNPTSRNQNELTSADSQEVTGTPSALSLTSFNARELPGTMIILLVLVVFGLSLAALTAPRAVLVRIFRR